MSTLPKLFYPGVALLTLLLMGQACTPRNQNLTLANVPPQAAMLEDETASSGDVPLDPEQQTPGESGSGAVEEPEAQAVPYYIEYSETEFTRAREASKAILLYFWASWCPICRAEEPKIKAWVEGSGLNVAGFRVNFDTEAVLKATYRIPYQHTTVILNSTGQETARFAGPVEQATLIQALKEAAE